ncbi:MAG: riboflavin kinase, partial [Bacteroidota bacterium]
VIFDTAPTGHTLRLLTTTDEKIALFEQTGIDNLIVVPFTFEFSQMSADEYIQRFLVDKFHPRYIVIGYDHRFGLNRRGDINYLRWHEKSLNYKVVEISKEEIDDLEVSSTRIRQHVEKSEMVSAGKLMNHFFTLTGKVVRGQQIGASIGFPTANLFIENKVKLIPPDGIYAAYVLHDGMRHRAMLYIGARPTIGGNLKRTIEVHIFDFSQTIYEKEIQVELADFIRPDEKYQDLSALKSRLAEDKIAAEQLLDKANALLRHWENLSKPTVDVVILNYNGRQYLEKHLPSVLKTNYGNFRVVVADNASKDDSLAFMRKTYPQVQVVELKKNYGFAKGYNLALADLEPDYFVLLNSDVETPENWLEPLVDLMEKDKTIAAVQPKIRALNQPDHFEYAGAAGGWIDFLGYPFCRGRIFGHTEKDLGQYDSTAEVFWASGACMAVRAPLFKGFGGFDDEFFAHLEEIDLCWRLKRAGYKIMATHRSIVYHLG